MKFKHSLVRKVHTLIKKNFGFSPQANLRAAAPLLTTHVADIEILQILRIILDVDHILLRAGAVRCTITTRTLHRLQVRQCRILPGELIEQNLIAFARALLY